MSVMPEPRSWGTGRWIVLVFIVALGSYLLGSYFGGPNGTPFENKTSTVSVRGVGSKAPSSVGDTIDFEQFWELWEVLQTKFYKQPLDERAMLYGAMQGLAESTGDPYTVFLEPKIADEFNQSLEGKFDGIGAEIGIKKDQLQVIASLPETPAARAGLLAGDAILLIDATSTEGMTVEQAVSLIRGKKGTNVKLTIGRVKNDAATRLDLSIVRDTIVVKSVRSRMERGNIAIIEITHFNSDTTTEFGKAVDLALSKEAKGIILDMRNNPGGFLDRATAVAGEWVGDDVVVIERRQGVTVDTYHGTGKGRLKGVPTIVLVNEGSASASEIVAGALQDYGVAQLVGQKTFGKGSVQDYSQLRDGTAIKITVAEWLTPKGRFINEIGIDPDIAIERTEEDYHAERDPQLDKALELLGAGQAPSSTETGTR